MRMIGETDFGSLGLYKESGAMVCGQVRSRALDSASTRGKQRILPGEIVVLNGLFHGAYRRFHRKLVVNLRRDTLPIRTRDQKE
jgi:hypothetical protein